MNLAMYSMTEYIILENKVNGDKTRLMGLKMDRINREEISN